MCNCYVLFFVIVELEVLFFYFGVVVIREVYDVVVNGSSLVCFIDFFVGCVGVGIVEVVYECFVEEDCVLRNNFNGVVY